MARANDRYCVLPIMSLAALQAEEAHVVEGHEHTHTRACELAQTHTHTHRLCVPPVWATVE